MTPDRLREILAAYGADPARWPADNRVAAAALSSDAGLADLIAEAGALDATIAHHRPARVSIDINDLVARVTATAQPRGHFVATAGGATTRWRLPFGWTRVAGFASVALIGFFVGLADLDGAIAPAIDDDAESGIFGVFEESPW